MYQSDFEVKTDTLSYMASTYQEHLVVVVVVVVAVVGVVVCVCVCVCVWGGGGGICKILVVNLYFCQSIHGIPWHKKIISVHFISIYSIQSCVVFHYSN